MAASPQGWYRRIGAHAETHRLGVVLTCDTGFVLHREPDTVHAPEVAFVSHERYRAFGDDVSALPGPPDIAIEVLSPGRRQVRSYRNLLQPQITAEPGELTADDLLPGFSLPVSDIFDL